MRLNVFIKERGSPGPQVALKLNDQLILKYKHNK